MTDAAGGFDEDHAPDDAPARRRRPDRARVVLLVATAVLALMAVVTVVATDDARWLRLGVVAALWAALVATWALVRRGQDPEAAALRETYELELEGEIAARREHELTVEVELRRELETARSTEIEGLRAEVERLRTVMEQRPGADRRPAYGVVPGDDVGSADAAATGTAGPEARARLQVVGGSSGPPGSSGPAWDGGRGSYGPPAGRPVAPAGHAGPLTHRPAGPGRAHERRDPLSDPLPGPQPVPAGPTSPAQSWAAAVPTHYASTGRTVAELLAAHAAAPVPARRRRHDGP